MRGDRERREDLKRRPEKETSVTGPSWPSETGKNIELGGRKGRKEGYNRTLSGRRGKESLAARTNSGWQKLDKGIGRSRDC